MKFDKKIAFFLFRFFSVYFLLVIIYQIYLTTTQHSTYKYEVDPITNQVSYLTIHGLQILGVDAFNKPHEHELSVKIFIGKQYVARVIEGCNAISVIMLFVALVIAFKKDNTTTLKFMLIGGLSIFLINILRIMFLSYAVYQFPEYTSVLHKVVFPSIIYGYVILLWVYWLRLFTFKEKWF